MAASLEKMHERLQEILGEINLRKANAEDCETLEDEATRLRNALARGRQMLTETTTKILRG